MPPLAISGCHYLEFLRTAAGHLHAPRSDRGRCYDARHKRVVAKVGVVFTVTRIDPSDAGTKKLAFDWSGRLTNR